MNDETASLPGIPAPATDGDAGLPGVVVPAEQARQHMPLTRDAILKVDDLDSEWVPVPEWGGEVLVKALTGRERDAFEASCQQERPILDARGKPVKGRTEMVYNRQNVRAKLVVRSIVDDQTGERMFTDGDAEHLGKKSAAALDRVFEVAAKLSRLGDDDIEELAGNSEAAQSGDSASTSPETSDAPSESY